MVDPHPEVRSGTGVTWEADDTGCWGESVACCLRRRLEPGWKGVLASLTEEFGVGGPSVAQAGVKPALKLKMF